LNAVIEVLSVPWTLITRNTDGHTAQITIRARPCDGYTGAWADRKNPARVNVLVDHPVAACGPATPRTITLHSATVTTTLPTKLEHAPTGAQDDPRS
jgi:hypothetical protein